MYSLFGLIWVLFTPVYLVLGSIWVTFWKHSLTIRKVCLSGLPSAHLVWIGEGLLYILVIHDGNSVRTCVKEQPAS